MNQIPTIYIYNTLTQQKELFSPLTPGKIGLYVCGMTVYDTCHIGHGRIFLWFDSLARYLRSIGYQVTYVRNITDIDDKIIKRAIERNIPYQQLTAEVIAAMQEEEKTLNIIPPDFVPRVTQHIPEIIAMINTLLIKGFAYKAKNNDVYYSVDKFKKYGSLAHQDLANLELGARVEPNIDKKNPLDFVLWKAAKPQEPSWPSPWGLGRPGWHIECSAMAKKYLGNSFDIHGGGNDLQFPHHQNELAQSEAANNAPFASYWMHVGFVQNNQEKMSKSLGNFCTLKAALTQYHPEVLRLFILTSHYRSPLNFSQDNLKNAESALRRLYLTLRNLETPNITAATLNHTLEQNFHQAMTDDFNTPQAISYLFGLAHEINQLRTTQQLAQAQQLGALLKHLGNTVGLLQESPDVFLKFGANTQLIESMIHQRQQARLQKDYQAADQIRDHLASMGITLEDTKNGTTWLVEERKTK